MENVENVENVQSKKMYNSLTEMLIDLEEKKSLLWRFHPLNSDRISITQEYNRLVESIDEIEKELKVKEQ